MRVSLPPYLYIIGNAAKNPADRILFQERGKRLEEE